MRIVLAAVAACVAWGCGGATSTDLIGPSEVRCAVSLTPPEGEFAPGQSSGSVAVAAERECAWSARAEADWIAVTAGTGQGDGHVEFVVAENPVPVARAGRIAVGDTAVEIVQTAGPCRFTVQPDGVTMGAEGGRVDVEVGTHPACGWSAASDEPWIAVSGTGSGEGPGTITLQVGANAGSPRAGHVSIADLMVTITQDAVCTFSLGSPASHVSSAGGTRTVPVTAPGWCDWTAASQSPWIALSGAAGTGSGEVTLTVAPNAGPARSGSVTIAGQLHTVTQEAAPCTFAVDPVALRVPFSGGRYAIAVTAPAWCQWGAVSQAPWIQITSGSAGAGSGTVMIEVSRRAVPLPRAGTLIVAGQTVTVTQTLILSDEAP